MDGKEILEQLKYLDEERQAAVCRALSRALLAPVAANGFKPPAPENAATGRSYLCPQCNRPTVKRNGVYYPKSHHAAMTQRFLCRECRAAAAGRPGRSLLKQADGETLEKFFYLMLDGVCLRHIAKTLRITHGKSLFMQYSILVALQRGEIMKLVLENRNEALNKD